jgi:CRP/FNR family transcriptional regulator
MREILKESRLFSQLDDDSLSEIESTASVKHVEKGEMIFYEGDQAVSFFIVGSGKVKVFKLSPDGKEQILMIASPGDTFAEAALFAGGKYPASAQALEPTQLIVIYRDRFVALLGKNPDLALNLIARLSQLLRQLTVLVEGLSLTDVTTRLAHHLVRLIDDVGQENELILTLGETKTVLASQLGTIPETLSRSLAKLSREGVIKVDGSRIHVLDIDRLRKIGS